MDDADPALNVKLTGGEEVRVPEVGRSYIVGKRQNTRRLPRCRMAATPPSSRCSPSWKASCPSRAGFVLLTVELLVLFVF
jgi:hypothetical protein